MSEMVITGEDGRTQVIAWPPRECAECGTMHAFGNVVLTETEPGELHNQFVCWSCLDDGGQP